MPIFDFCQKRIRCKSNEISSLTGLKKAQVRNTANYYGSEIVPVGRGKIDLLTRAYKGRGLRVTPTRQDIEAGIVHSDELSIYLWLFRVLSKDKYLFVLEKKYGKTSFLGVGIKKYFHSYKGEYHLVSILEDEILGKHGYCPECKSPMIWDKKRGWRSAREDEYFDLSLDKSFSKLK